MCTDNTFLNSLRKYVLVLIRSASMCNDGSHCQYEFTRKETRTDNLSRYLRNYRT